MMKDAEQCRTNGERMVGGEWGRKGENKGRGIAGYILTRHVMRVYVAGIGNQQPAQ